MQPYSTTKKIGFFAGPLLALLVYIFPLEVLTQEGNMVIAVALWMISWWLTETVSISVTALLPLLLFPLLKVMPLADVGENYGSPIVFLFFGGFVLALALEKVNLHKRIALVIINKTGTTQNKIILGFMIATAFMSMWISNTASTVVMLPIAISVIKLLIDDEDGFTKKDRNFATSLMLSIAFSANAGGIATIIGTPPNSVLIGLLENQYNINISFFKWLTLGLPFSIVLITVIYFVLVKFMYPTNGLVMKTSKNVISNELSKLGKIAPREMQVIIIFLIVVLLWIFRGFINDWLPSIKLTDTIISVFGAIALFVIPFNFKKGEFILKWGDTKNLSWGILILFGGGLALAKAMSNSGVVDYITQLIASNSNISILLTVTLLITFMLFMTELMSNVALVAVLSPVIAGIAIGLNIPLTHLLIPVTIASSCAFMLPMATPPNAIVFASGHIKVSQMAKVGIIINSIAIIMLIILFKYIIPLIF